MDKKWMEEEKKLQKRKSQIKMAKIVRKKENCIVVIKAAILSFPYRHINGDQPIGSLRHHPGPTLILSSLEIRFVIFLFNYSQTFIRSGNVCLLLMWPHCCKP